MFLLRKQGETRGSPSLFLRLTLLHCDVFDDAATGQGLLNYFLRGMNCKAITDEEVLTAGLPLEELRSRSFVKILNGRRNQSIESI